MTPRISIVQGLTTAELLFTLILWLYVIYGFIYFGRKIIYKTVQTYTKKRKNIDKTR